MPVDFPGLMPTGHVSNHTNMVTLIKLTLKLGEVSNEMYVYLTLVIHMALTLPDPCCGNLGKASSRIVWSGYSV